MKGLISSRFSRFTAWTLTLAMCAGILPVEVVAQARNEAVKQPQTAAIPAVKPVPAVKELSASQMQHIYGRGYYRDPYLCGTMPWHRSFHDVNMCTGNLFKSFTDIQVAPARGAGLVLQRTYNSNDDRAGAFGKGWTHAYEIRMQEASEADPDNAGTIDAAVRTDFFGGKHKYTRDADGLYTPPVYTHDWTKSNYQAVLTFGPENVLEDTETSLDGSIKHFRQLSDSSHDRVCDYIEDRHGNRTNLHYNLTVAMGDGATRTLLTDVTDPSGRVLNFQWANVGNAAEPMWRVRQVTAPLQTGQLQVVRYDYENGNLSAVHQDPATWYPTNLTDLTGSSLSESGSNHLDRTTTFAYSDFWRDEDVNEPEKEVKDLLASITDPLGHHVSYTYQYGEHTKSVWVKTVTEPGGESGGQSRNLIWEFECYEDTGWNGPIQRALVKDAAAAENENTLGYNEAPQCIEVISGACLRTEGVEDLNEGIDGPWMEFEYDDKCNVTTTWCKTRNAAGGFDTRGTVRVDSYTYGRNGNVLTHIVKGLDGQEETGYWDETNYFQKKYTKDVAGRYTYYCYGATNDANKGNRGNLLAVWDAMHRPQSVSAADPTNVPTLDPNDASPKFKFAYNTYGQKISETNPNGVVTQYTYNAPGQTQIQDPWGNTDSWGNLIQVVQDPGTAPHVNRVTWMAYDAAGRVTNRRDPNGRDSTVSYNNLGQPTQAVFPATASTPQETIDYMYQANGRIDNVKVSHNNVCAITTSMVYELGCDRVASVTEHRGSSSYIINYEYTLRGSLLKKTLPSGESWDYAYVLRDAAGNILNRGLLQMSSGDPGSAGASPLWVTYHQSSSDPGNAVCNPFTTTEATRYDTESFTTNPIQWDEIYNTKYVTSVTGTKLVAYCGVSTIYDGKSVPGENVGNYIAAGYVRSTGRAMHVVNEYHWYIEGENGQPGHWDAVALSTNDYQYDISGNRTDNTARVLRKDNTYKKRHEHYVYDALNRLTQVTYTDLDDATNAVLSTETKDYAFDAMGNRKSDLPGGSPNYTYDNANRLTSYNSAPYTYDYNGNQTSGGGRTNTWDSQNRLSQCVANGVISTFTYGADGLRRQMSVTDATSTNVTDYVLEGSNVVEEIVNGTHSATYMTGMRGVEFRRDVSTDKINWMVYDGLGSTLAEVGDMQWAGDHWTGYTPAPALDVYGNPREADTATGKQRFCGNLGHTTEPATGGLIYMRARWMDPVTGRFISEDPAGDGVNWYAYCGGNPVNAVDSTGESIQIFHTWATLWAAEAKAIYQSAGGGLECLEQMMQFIPTECQTVWWFSAAEHEFLGGCSETLSIIVELDPSLAAAYCEGQSMFYESISSVLGLARKSAAASGTIEEGEEIAAEMITVL